MYEDYKIFKSPYSNKIRLEDITPKAGSLEIWLEVEEGNDKAFSRPSYKDLPQAITFLEYCPEKDIIITGNATGVISIYKILSDEFDEHKEAFSKKLHKGAITGTFYDHENKQFYSISEDKHFIRTDMGAREPRNSMSSITYSPPSFSRSSN